MDFDLNGAIQTLKEIPLDLVDWTVKNSERKDIKLRLYRDRFGKKQSEEVLPFYERPIMIWNANPYILDGGNGGYGEKAGTFWLLPYWMGRYHGYIK